MVSKLALVLCILFLLGTLSVEAQRDGRRRSGRRKPTTESPPPIEEPENESNPQKVDAELEAAAKKPSSAQPTEAETNAPSSEKEPANSNQGGPPFIVPRGTRKPRPMHVRNNGELRPRPTLPTFARKRGPKPERRDFKKIAENSVETSSTSTTTTKPARGSSRRNNSQDRGGFNPEKVSHANDGAESATETAPKKRFGGGNTRRPSRGSRRHNTPAPES